MSDESNYKKGSQKELVDRWNRRIADGKSFRDIHKAKGNWERFIKEYEGVYDVGALTKQIPIIPINLVFAYVHTEIPRLYYKDPYFAVNPKGMSYIKNAKVLEVAINYLAAELSLKKEIFKTLLDCLLVGHGWLKFGYSGTFGKMVTPEDIKGKGQNKKALDEENEFIKSEEIFVLHVPWEDMLFDPLSKDPPYDAHWIAHRIVKPLDSVKKSDLYENTSDIKANYKPDAKKNIKTDIDLVELWEIWDKDSNMIFTWTSGADKLLRQIPNPYFMEGFPFSMLKFNPDPQSPYPISDIALVEPQFIEMIKLVSMMFNHLKRWNRQIFIEKNSLSPEEMSKYMTGIDGAVIQPEPGSISGNKVFLPAYPAMQAEIFQVQSMLQQFIDTIVGQTQVDRGAPAQTRTRTLGEVKIQQTGSLTRSERRKDALEDFLEEVARKIIQLVKQFQLTPKYVRSMGEQDISLLKQTIPGFDGVGLEFNKDDVQGEYDVEVKAGSTIPLSKENRLQVLSDILKLGPTIGIVPGGKVARAVGREILRDLNIKEAERAYLEEEKELNAMMQMQQAQIQGMGGMGGMLGQSQGQPQGPSNIPMGQMGQSNGGLGV